LDSFLVKPYVVVVHCNTMVQAKECKMKRQYATPDLLATLTADALFGSHATRRPEEPPAPAKPGSGILERFATWARANRDPAADLHRSASRPARPSIKDQQ
jgi:hypothetical protein